MGKVKNDLKNETTILAISSFLVELFEYRLTELQIRKKTHTHKMEIN